MKRLAEAKLDFIFSILDSEKKDRDNFAQIPLYAPQPMPLEPPEREKKPNSGGSVTIIGEEEEDNKGVIIIDL